MPTPYTTKSGVQIGSLYTPTARPHHDRDAIRIQNALLATPDKHRIDRAGGPGTFSTVVLRFPHHSVVTSRRGLSRLAIG